MKFDKLTIKAQEALAEAQSLARHSTPDLTINVYGRTRADRPSELTDRVAQKAFLPQKCAHSVHEAATGTDGVETKLFRISNLRDQNQPAGGGTRTPALDPL